DGAIEKVVVLQPFGQQLEAQGELTPPRAMLVELVVEGCSQGALLVALTIASASFLLFSFSGSAGRKTSLSGPAGSSGWGYRRRDKALPPGRTPWPQAESSLTP